VTSTLRRAFVHLVENRTLRLGAGLVYYGAQIVLFGAETTRARDVSRLGSGGLAKLPPAS
jgi:hypothetical protein